MAKLRDPDPALHEVVAEISTEFPEVPVSEHVVEGPGGPALLSQAAHAALLVVGARGRAAYPGMLLGSVAEYCVRPASRPGLFPAVRMSPALPNAGPQRTIMRNEGTLTRHARHDSVASSGGAPDR